MHTPGPYRVASVGIEEEGYREILAPNGDRLATLGRGGNGVHLRGNATLFAASADLLKASKLALDYYRSHGTQKYNPYEVEQTLEWAIAKAEGRV